jgi:hypothetical protein
MTQPYRYAPPPPVLDLEKLQADLERMSTETCAGCARFHAEVHEPIAAAWRAVKAWRAGRAAA